MRIDSIPRSRLFVDCESGMMTAFGLFMFLALVLVGGFATDYANAVRMQTRLQVAADTAAHAALMEREHKTPDEARARAIEVAQTAIPSTAYGAALQPTDIRFGRWDPTNEQFTIDENSRSAVLVDTQSAASRGNGLATFFLGFIGLDHWTIVQQSVFETYVPRCLQEGYVAEVGIKLQNGNVFMEPFCLHSNDWMDFSNGNTFQSGTVVMSPDTSQISANNNTNVGLADATQEVERRKIRILERVQEIYDGLQDPNSQHYRNYISEPDPIDIDPKDGVTLANWTEGRIHRFTCSKPKESVDFDTAITLRNGVLITNCVLKLSAATLEDVAIVTLNSDAASINSNSGLTVGKADNCAPGGGAQLVTMGGVRVSTNMAFNNGQIIAVGDVDFTSHASGHWGASIVSGGVIDSNSHNVMRGCFGVGMEANFNAGYFRLAR